MALFSKSSLRSHYYFRSIGVHEFDQAHLRLCAVHATAKDDDYDKTSNVPCRYEIKHAISSNKHKVLELYADVADLNTENSVERWETDNMTSLGDQENRQYDVTEETILTAFRSI